jgi:hypothetical protein
VRVVTLAWKLNIIEQQHTNKIVCYSEEITGTEVPNPKTFLGLIAGKDVTFRGSSVLRYSVIRIE